MHDETRMLISIAEQAELARLKLNELVASIKPEVTDLRLKQLIMSIEEFLAALRGSPRG